jgi:hypothetical protein
MGPRLRRRAAHARHESRENGSPRLPRLTVSIFPTNRAPTATDLVNAQRVVDRVHETVDSDARNFRAGVAAIRAAACLAGPRYFFFGTRGLDPLRSARLMLGNRHYRARRGDFMRAVQVHIATQDSAASRATTRRVKYFLTDRFLLEALISDNEPDVATGRQRPNTSCKQLANLLQLRPPNRRLPSAHIAFVCG